MAHAPSVLQGFVSATVASRVKAPPPEVAIVEHHIHIHQTRRTVMLHGPIFRLSVDQQCLH